MLQWGFHGGWSTSGSGASRCHFGKTYRGRAHTCKGDRRCLEKKSQYVRGSKRALITLTSEKMTLQMLGMEVCLGTMRAWKFSVSILNGNHRVLSSSSAGGRSSRTSWSAWQDAASALRTYNMSRLLTLLKNGVGLHQRAGTVGRRDAWLGHDAAGRHWAKHGRPAATSRGRRNRLRVRNRSCCLGHHGSRSTISRVRRVWVGRHRVKAASSAWLRRLLVAGQVTSRSGSVWGSRRPRGVRVASIERLHRGGRRLQRRESLGKRRTRLQLVR